MPSETMMVSWPSKSVQSSYLLGVPDSSIHWLDSNTWLSRRFQSWSSVKQSHSKLYCEFRVDDVGQSRKFWISSELKWAEIVETNARRPSLPSLPFWIRWTHRIHTSFSDQASNLHRKQYVDAMIFNVFQCILNADVFVCQGFISVEWFALPSASMTSLSRPPTSPIRVDTSVGIKPSVLLG